MTSESLFHIGKKSNSKLHEFSRQAECARSEYSGKTCLLHSIPSLSIGCNIGIYTIEVVVL